MWDSAARAHVERELAQLERLFRDYSELLATAGAGADEPDLVQRTALSAVIQSFYQGVEAVLATVAKRVDGNMPMGADWHRQLLEQMVADSRTRPALISQATVGLVAPYLGFRHLARHTYPFILDWSRMGPLVRGMMPAFVQFRAEIVAFLGHAGQARECG